MTGLPRFSPPTNPNAHSFDSPPYHYTSSTLTPSLPSFASLKEQSGTRNAGYDGSEMASVSSRPSCSLCAELRPLVKDVADAVTELVESVRVLCNPSSRPPQDTPGHSPVRAAQWILERLRSAKQDVQNATRRDWNNSTNTAPVAAFIDRATSVSNPLKRPAERWEKDELQVLKRPRSGNTNEQHWQFPPIAFSGRVERRLSIDFAEKDYRPAYSPPPSESTWHVSPTSTHQNARALPSPSALAYPPPAAPSLPPPTAPSVGSPATTYQATASVHTTSTTSATSAHIADLQHQVTLKSLALQTLQSEYASLLQKLQRERVKSQTIEKKTSVAEQEVNDLTGKNDELAEQIKALSLQLVECEKKRDAERVEAQKEKDQWGRMLEMSSRLHAKVDAERQKLLQEKKTLVQRLAGFDAGTLLPTASSRNPSTPRADGPLVVDRAAHEFRGPDSATSVERAPLPFGNLSVDGDTVGLKRDIRQLTARIDALRAALLQAQSRTRELQEQSHALADQTSAAIDAAVKSDDHLSQSHSESSQDRTPSGRSTPARPPPAWSPGLQQTSSQAPQPPQSAVRSAKPATLDVYHSGGKVTTADLSVVARAGSPGPDVFGIAIQPTTSSPEELIQALGPLPSKTAPPPPFSFNPVSYHFNDCVAPRTQAWRPIHGASLKPERQSTDQHRPSRPRGSSPNSYRSSPGVMADDLSLSGSSGHSPEGYTSDPEPAYKRSELNFLPSLAELPRLRASGIAIGQSPSETRLRDSGYHTSSVMLPPPRPLTGGYLPHAPL